ncbi:MAG: DUF3109 family protein [Crocinitomicaceae bacterium]|jgi:hypothetical protein|nr:DUF3109 family protein [Crocinitomicaceae bacterium]MDC1195941.1 DUF3109 family protein [Crocinitomicaceae bacterium]|tara:strand:- start:224 stop:793 length:570 start_codon:yes stop_codon:yes gene_type:complete
MLVEIRDKVVSTQIFEKKFVCDLAACKGACCIEGDAGAPLTVEEVSILEDDLEAIKPYMREEGLKAIEEQGVFYIDQDNEPVTTLVNGAECAFVFFDEQGITKCSIEQANREGKTDFKKPISCHLYPIRVKEFDDFTALNFDKWDICSPACACGDELNVPVYKFLKEPIIRAFGMPFFDELEIVNKELK